MNNRSILLPEWKTPIGRMRGEIGPEGLKNLGVPRITGTFSSGRIKLAKKPVSLLNEKKIQSMIGCRSQELCLDRTTTFLEQYFRGNHTRELPELDWSAWSDFCRMTWTETMRVRFGRTRTYSAIAEAVGRPESARAVGGAMGRNPIVLIMPCHRIMGKSSNGRPNLTGFTGGLELKRQLLVHEGLLPSS
jgi:O-6-methylguanine DNA methyltransferase